MNKKQIAAALVIALLANTSITGRAAVVETNSNFVQAEAVNESSADSATEVTGKGSSKSEEEVTGKSSSKPEREEAGESSSKLEEEVTGKSSSKSEKEVTGESDSKPEEEATGESSSESEEEVTGESDSKPEEEVTGESDSKPEEEVTGESNSVQEEETTDESSSEPEEEVTDESSADSEEKMTDSNKTATGSNANPEDIATDSNATPAKSFFAPRNPKIIVDNNGQIWATWDAPETELNQKCVILETFDKNDKRITFLISSETGTIFEAKDTIVHHEQWSENGHLNEEGDSLYFRIIYSLEDDFTYDNFKKSDIPESEWSYSPKYVYEPAGEYVPAVEKETIIFKSNGEIEYQTTNSPDVLGYYYIINKKKIGAPEAEKKGVISGVRYDSITDGVGSTKGTHIITAFKNRMEEGYEYQIVFKTLANLNTSRNSVFCTSDWWDPQIGKSQVIDNLLNTSDSELVKGIKNSALEENELNQIRTDIIASGEIAAKYKELEDRYRQFAGLSGILYHVDNNLINAADIDIIGAALNQIEEIKFTATSLPAGFTKTNAIAMDISAYHGNDKKTKLQFPVMITIPVPQNMSASTLVINHYREDGINEAIIPKNNGDGTISFAITHFSKFVFTDTAADEENNNPVNNPVKTGSRNSSSSGSSSGGSSSIRTSNGSWKKDAIGWWFVKADGTYPIDSWYQCYYNGALNWYHFDNRGYGDSGWFVDKDGKTYFLNNDNTNQFGYMYTGWHWIDGKCYFFNNEAQTGTVGALLKNMVTPDGYTVNEAGAWTVDGIVQVK